MSKTLVAVISLVFGLILGGIGGTTLGGGAMAGMGVAAGLSTGICTTTQAAQDLGIMTPEQVDEVLKKASQNVSGTTDLPEGHEIAGSAEKCDEFLVKLREAQ